MTRSAYLIFTAFILSFLFVPHVRAADLPAGFKQVKKTLASAGTWANLRKTEDSIARKSESMVAETFAELPKESDGKIALSVSPNKYLTGSDDAEHCKKLTAEFEKQPLSFGPKEFSSIGEFSDWFSTLSQGKGDEGTQLYKKCDKSCSPSYVVTITRSEKGYSSTVATFCNQPRDKDENHYLLASGIPG